jgi:ABC-type sulfate transport system substrate-binding protein
MPHPMTTKFRDDRIRLIRRFMAIYGPFYLITLLGCCLLPAVAQDSILNASYDVSRELYREIDAVGTAATPIWLHLDMH